MKVEWDVSELTKFGENMLSSAFDGHLKNATKRLAKALLRWMKEFTPVDSYQLISGWDGNDFAVRESKSGYEVLIVNKTPYAKAVNDGHKAHNQFGGPYPIKPYNPKGAWGKPEGRIQVTQPYKWQIGGNEFYVFGHFFVERGVLRLYETSEVEQIILDELRKWWEGMF